MYKNMTLHVSVLNANSEFIKQMINLNNGLIEHVECHTDTEDVSLIQVMMYFNVRMVNRQKLLYGNCLIEIPFVGISLKVDMEEL